MGIVFKNNAKTTLASNLSNSATSATVTDGSVFPSLSAGEFFLITFDDGSNNEICKCTARSGNTLTIVRAQESTTARAFSSGDAAEGRVTAGVLETIQENIAAKSANQTVFNTTTAGGATTYNIGTNPGVEANAMVFLNGVLQHHDTISFSGTNLTFDAAPPNGMALEVIIDNLINLQSSNLTVDSFTAADVSGNPQTDFTLSDTPAAETNLIVFVDGVFQDQDAYTISSNTLTITTGVIAGRGVTVYVINPVNIGTPSDSTVTSAKLSGNITMPGTLTVGSNDVAFDSPTFVVDHTNSRVGLGTASPSVPVDIVGEVKTSSHINIGGNLVKASGDLTLDVAGDIILDADGDDIKIAEGGTVVMEIKHESSSIDFLLNTGNEDFKFKGSDDGSNITALQLDMSEAGKAIFNAGASFGSNVSIVSTGDGLSLSRSGYDTYSFQHSSGNGMAIYNVTDSRSEAFFDGSGKVVFGGTSNHAGSSLGYMLTVDSAGASGSILEAHRTGNSRLEIYQNATGGNYIDSLGTSPFTVFAVGGTEKWRITDNLTGASGGKIVQTIASGGGNFLEVTHSGNESWSLDVQSGAGALDYLSIGIDGGNRGIKIYEEGSIWVGDAPSATDSKTFSARINQSSGVHYPIVIGGGTHTAGVATGLAFDPEGYGYRNKIAILAEGTGAGYSRGRLHIALENTNTNDEVNLADSKMCILEDGRIGIGDQLDSPHGRLHVKGNSTNQATVHETASCKEYRNVATSSTQTNTNRYWHIKTNIATSTNVMFVGHVEGYAYGDSGHIVDVKRSGYMYSPSAAVINTQTINNGSGSSGLNLYNSSDGYLTFVCDFGGAYYSGGAFHIQFPAPAGYNTNFSVQAHTMNNTSTGHY